MTQSDMQALVNRWFEALGEPAPGMVLSFAQWMELLRGYAWAQGYGRRDAERAQ